MKKKVLFFAISKDEMSGGANMILNAIKNIDRTKYEVELLTQSECTLTKNVRKEGVKTHILSIPNTSLKKGVKTSKLKLLLHKIYISLLLFTYSFKVTLFIKKNNYDIVWCENLRVLMVAALLKFSRIKLVYNMWSCVNSKIGLRIISYFSNHIVVEADFQKKLFYTIRSKPQITVIHTQIDSEIFEVGKPKIYKKNYKDNNVKVIGFLGGARYSKGYDILIEIAYDLVIKKEYNNLIFYIAGISKKDDLISNRELSEKVKKLNNNIILENWIDIKSDFYNNIDMFISSSRSEGLPGAVREAMGFGLPVIATDVGGTAEAIGNTGIIVYENEKNKVIESFSRHIINLVHNEKEAIVFGEKAQNRARKCFIGDDWVRKLEDVFSKV